MYFGGLVPSFNKFSDPVLPRLVSSSMSRPSGRSSEKEPFFSFLLSFVPFSVHAGPASVTLHTARSLPTTEM